MAESSVSEQEVDQIAQKIMTQIEHTKSKDLAESNEEIEIFHLTNMHHAKKLLEHADEAPTKQERDIGRKAVVKALLVSTWHSRLYFIIRSFIMGIVGSLITLTFVLIFHSITLVLSIPLGILSFVFSLAISRLLDVPIVKATKAMVNYLAKHEGLRNFILNYF
jgi:hypothetical protein